MDLKELIVTRRTVNNYLPQDVPRALVDEALRLSLWAPNHRLTYPWVYTWVGPQARLRLADLTVELKSKRGPLNDIKKAAIRANIMNPAHLISLGIRRSDEHTQHEDYATLSCSVQIASMFLWREKIGTKWSTGGNWNHPETYKILGIDPTLVALEGGLLIGVPQIVPAAPERPALSQFMRETE